MDSLNTTDGGALVEMKQKITVSNGEAVCSRVKMAYSKTMDSEFETIRADYVKKMKKNIKDRFKKRDMHVSDYLSKV